MIEIAEVQIRYISTRFDISSLHSFLKNIYYGIDGEPQAIVQAERLVNDLGGKSVIIEKELKPLYHILCVFSSSYMMILLNTISELAKQLNLKASWTEVFGPLMTSSMENTIKHSSGNVLTGPIVRGDFDTIEVHLKTLSHYAPEFLPLYTVGGIEIARVAKRGGKIDQENFENVVAQFKKFIKSTSFTKTSKVND